MRHYLPLITLILLTACATPQRERVTLLPDANGKVGQVVVISQGQNIKLDQAYATANIQGKQAQAGQSSKEEVSARYQAALSATPLAARSYMLHFVFDKTALLPESRKTLKEIIADYQQRPGPELMVIGHTDQAGNAKYNEQLSQRRASAVRDLLIAEGIKAEEIEMAWRGDREPLITDSRKPYEPQNRRVEVKIR